MINHFVSLQPKPEFLTRFNKKANFNSGNLIPNCIRICGDDGGTFVPLHWKVPIGHWDDFHCLNFDIYRL